MASGADLAGRIRARRERCGLKQADLAAALRVSPQAVSKWERGENAPDLSLLLPLAQLLDVSVDWLLGASDDPREVFDATVVATGVQSARQVAATLAPRELARWANGICYHVTEALIAQHGLPVKTIGAGGVVGLFSGQDHAQRALTAALAAAATTTEAKLKIGLASGEVYFGPLGHPEHARPDVVGQAFVTAFLIRDWGAEHTASGVVVCSTTADRLPADPRLGSAATVELPGVQTPLRLHPARRVEDREG